MIQINNRAMRIVPYTVVWFAAKPNLWGCLLKYYKQSKSSEAVPGYRKEDFFTKIIDITVPVPDIEANFDKNTSYEIRRAIKDGVSTVMGTGIKAFIDFYNAFAVTKGLKKLIKNFINTSRTCLSPKRFTRIRILLCTLTSAIIHHKE
ncbi:hypothetical protein ACQ86K_19360 [Mucilaginibacter sp. P19]|uniref:hypothetical protein n=1 Tax=Mucilaginibacter sp. P19 TaxID=3423947 RepID=UPI003D668D05